MLSKRLDAALTISSTKSFEDAVRDVVASAKAKGECVKTAIANFVRTPNVK